MIAWDCMGIAWDDYMGSHWDCTAFNGITWGDSMDSTGSNGVAW